MKNHVDLSIDGQTHRANIIQIFDQDGTLHPVLMFDAAFKALELWKSHDPAHRHFDWTTDTGNAVPSTFYAAWVDEHGVLKVVHGYPFWDGVDCINGYTLAELTQLPELSRLGETHTTGASL